MQWIVEGAVRVYCGFPMLKYTKIDRKGDITNGGEGVSFPLEYTGFNVHVQDKHMQ